MNVSEYQTRYVVLRKLPARHKGQWIPDRWRDSKSSMTDGDRARLNGYRLDDMQYRIFLDASSDITDEDRKKCWKLCKK